MRLLVVGAGSTGGYFGARLARAGRDVTFLVRPARAVQLRSSGLQVISPHGDFKVAPALVTSDHLEKHFDLVLLGVKAYALEQALDDFAPAMDATTMVLPLLNGIRHIELLTQRFGAAAVIGGVCRVATTLDDDGRIVQLAPFHELAYGEMNGERTPRLQRVHEFLSSAGFDTELSETVEQDMWEKWLLLAALGGIVCLMRGSIGEIVAAPGGPDFVQRFLAEVVAAVTAAGHAPRAKFLDLTRKLLLAEGSALTSSMYRDLQQGRPVEADQILGDLLGRAQRGAVATPMIAAAYTQLCVYQNQRSSGAK
jgi:2-dehydropantoate 2-reductase